MFCEVVVVEGGGNFMSTFYGYLSISNFLGLICFKFIYALFNFYVSYFILFYMDNVVINM